MTLTVWRRHLSQEEAIGATERRKEEIEEARACGAAQGCLLVSFETDYMTPCLTLNAIMIIWKL